LTRNLILASLLAATLAVAGVATTSQGARRHGCSIKGATVISQTETARVLATKPRASGRLQIRKVYACAFNKGRLISLGTDRAFQEEDTPAPAQQRLEAIALDELPGAAGDAVAYSVQRCPANTTADSACTADVRVLSLATGRQAAHAGAGARVWTIVVRAPAYAAFISERADRVVEVHRLVRDDDRVVDTGTEADIDVGSLAASEGWRNVSGADGLPGLDFFWKTTAGPRSASIKCGFPGDEACPLP
jgi:hypothetical protein